jgi:CspA family cold shock protein
MVATALIVGCDGVLVHKARGRKDAARRAAHAAAWREACASVGLAWSDGDFERLAGVPAADAFARLAAEQGAAGVDTAAASRAKAAAQKRLSSGEPYAPAVAFTRDAAAAGAAVALAGNVRRDHAAAVLAKTGLAAVVRAVVARDTAPDAPARLLAAAAALGMPLSACHVLAADDETLAAAQHAGCAGATDARGLPGYAEAAAAMDGPPEPPRPPRLKGSVKSYTAKNQYGFITPDDGGPDVYVPALDICRRAPRELKAGERVEYWTEAREEGRLKALKVTAEGQPPWKDGKKKKKKGRGKAGSVLGAAAAAQRTGAAAMAADAGGDSETESSSDGMDTDA